MTGIKKKNISRENLIASKLSAKEDVKTYGFMKFSRLNYEFVNKKKSYSCKEISLSLFLSWKILYFLRQIFFHSALSSGKSVMAHVSPS